MSFELDPHDEEAILKWIKECAAEENLRISIHADAERVAEEMTTEDVMEAISSAILLENHPEHGRGPCCLLYGRGTNGRDIHVVCSTTAPTLIIITVYEPKEPKWRTPTQRRR